MSKEVLLGACNADNAEQYVWSMFFYKIDRRSSEQPYKFYKIRFKEDLYLLTYAKSLMSSVKKFQIEPIDTVQKYDGHNTKISCDKIVKDDELISESWKNFIQALSTSSDVEIEGKINGYVLFGNSRTEENKTITFIRTANPFLKLTNKKNVLFTATTENELDLFTDTIYRLYLNTDILMLGSVLYTFNHNFEALFDIEKTIAKTRNSAVETICSTNSFSNVEDFKNFASQYTSSRTFITLNQERVERIRDIEKRREVASMLDIDLDESGNLIIDSKLKAARLIKYLCYKIFQDAETHNVLEASTITMLSN